MRSISDEARPQLASEPDDYDRVPHDAGEEFSRDHLSVMVDGPT